MVVSAHLSGSDRGSVSSGQYSVQESGVESGQWYGQTVFSLINGGQNLFDLTKCRQNLLGLINICLVLLVWSPTVSNPRRNDQYLSWVADVIMGAFFTGGSSFFDTFAYDSLPTIQE